MNNTPSNTDDIIQTSDIIERIEELEATLEAFTDAANEANEVHFAAIEAGEDTKETGETLAEANKALAEWSASDEAGELAHLNSFMDDMEGMGGDEQWKGVWYPSSAIRETYFNDAMDELLEDIGDIPKNLPSYLSITVDYVALKMDYSCADFEGITYYFR